MVVRRHGPWLSDWGDNKDYLKGRGIGQRERSNGWKSIGTLMATLPMNCSPWVWKWLHGKAHEIRFFWRDKSLSRVWVRPFGAYGKHLLHMAPQSIQMCNGREKATWEPSRFVNLSKWIRELGSAKLFWLRAFRIFGLNNIVKNKCRTAKSHVKSRSSNPATQTG